MIDEHWCCEDECDEPLVLPLCDPLFGFHDVPQNVVDAGQVTLTL
jgi:hypothetical protein